MTLRQLAIPLFSTAVLAGLVLLGYLFGTFQSEDVSPNAALLQQIKSAPLSWGYALGSGILFLGFLAYLPVQLPVWRLHFSFRGIDSASLDANPELCRRFYHAALEFRCRHGEKRFFQHIVSHFNFFYVYHNDALHWMNRLVNRIHTDQLPVDMIIDSICSGQIGRVCCGISYGGGLPSAFVTLNHPVYLHARMDHIDVWSVTSSVPICALERRALTLVPGQHHPRYVSVYLKGLDKFSHKSRQLELRLPVLPENGQQDMQAQVKETVVALQQWLEKMLPINSHTSQENFGIDVAEIGSLATPDNEPSAATPLLAQLQQMLGSHIDAIFSHTTLTLADPDIVQSTVVLCSGLGIITITDVPLTGSIAYSGDSHWLQTNDVGSQWIANACLDARRSKIALINRLVDQNLNRWPVHGLVVFSHPDVQPELELGGQQIQCDVTTLDQLPKWFVSQTTDNTIRFTKDDYNKLIGLLDPARVGAETEELDVSDIRLQQNKL